ncbi:MAG: hypothetical protein QOE92_1233, partial [Chloroflexota bacterium]|nr:hypothetical protein [Chloroflexota bacterium]
MRRRRLTRGTWRRLGALGLPAFFAVGAALALQGQAPVSAAETGVTAAGGTCPGDSAQWKPSAVLIETGQTIRFYNCTNLQGDQVGDHGLNVGALAPATCSNTGAWSPGVPGQDQSTDCTFPSAGDYTYLCTLHTDMTGTVTVNDPP